MGDDEPMTGWERQRSIAGALFLVALAEVAMTLVAGAVSGLDWQRMLNLLVVPNAAIGLSMAVAGWPIAVHRPANPIGWLLLAGGCSYASTAAGITVLAWAGDHGWQGPPWRVVATVTNGGWTWGFALFLPLTLLLFPDGRFPSRRWRWLALLIAIDATVLTETGLLPARGLATDVGFQDYVNWSGYQHIAWLNSALGPALLFSYIGVLAALIVRFRRGSGQVRRQLMWVLLAMLILVTTFTLNPFTTDTVLTLLLVLIALVPLSITVAVLRHQLLDIQLVLSRSVLYLLLTAGVVATYLAVVAALEHALSRSGTAGPSLVATLLIAVAFNPARVWLQRWVERAIYGARQDPVRAIAKVGARLGQIGRPCGTELVGVLEALCQVMRLPSATISVGGAVIAAYGEQPPVRHAVPLREGEDGLGELVIGLRPGESRLGSADAHLIALLVAPIAVAVHAGALADELRRSRERVISAREEERRRLRRDLHDGLGPVLTGVVLNADAARRLLRTDPGRSACLLAELRDQTTSALEDIRRLVYDLRPPALDNLGLLGALRENAMVLSRRTDGAALEVIVDAPAALADLPAAVEVAAYRIVTEALTNVTRHSSAGTAIVTLTRQGDGLQVQIHDDGVNVGGGWQQGVGLTSIRERAAELGGCCTIRHDRTGGRIDVFLPLTAAPRKAAAVVEFPDEVASQP